MSASTESLFEFMPYGAPELKEVAKKYMFRGVLVGSAAWILLYILGFAAFEFAKRKPHETSVVVVPYRELAAPPPLTENEPPPQVAVALPVAPPTVAIPVPVPDAEAPPEQTIASQEEIAQVTPGVSSEGNEGQLVVQPPSEEELPKFGEYVYVEELPEAVTKVPPVYPDMAREASVDGTVMVQALVGKDGKVKDTKVVKSIPMLDAAAITAVKQWVFKPALSNNKPVAVWVAVPVRFTLH
jgi:protein TonB